MLYIVGIVCFVVGILFTLFFFGAKKLNGTLYIIPGEEDEPDIYRFEIDDLDELSKYKKIKLKVTDVSNS